MVRPRETHGFTLIEVIVAATIMLVGVLGTLRLLDGAGTQLALSDDRGGVTAVARRVSETARALPASALVPNNMTAALRAALPDMPDTDPRDTAWTVRHRGGLLTIDASVCLIDDSSDGIAAATARDATYCAAGATTSPPDLNPDDYRRVTVRVTPASRPQMALRQVSNVATAGAASVPTVTAMSMRTPTACSSNCPAITSGTGATFAATLGNRPARVNWLVGGNVAASCPPASTRCSGSGADWSFAWDLGTVARVNDTSSPNHNLCTWGSYVSDGVYNVGVSGIAADGTAGGSASLPITINRCQALAPRFFLATGRNGNGTAIDTEWQANPEGDIIGYRVYRGASLTNRQPVCPADISQGQVMAPDAALECTDRTPPSYTTSALYYGVYAIDRAPNGTIREGALSFLNVNTGNRPPNAVTSFAAGRSSGAVRLTWGIPSTQDPDSGDTIRSFRVYRRSGTSTTAPTLGERYDHELVRALCSGSSCTWLDPAPPATAHTYWVTSVDNNLRESALSTGRSA